MQPAHARGARLTALAAVLYAGCTTAPPDALVVHAAASLSESLRAVADRWTAAGGAPVALRFDASSKLAKQINAGAPADLFVSADAAWLDWLDRRGRLAPGARVDLLGNDLILVVPSDSPIVPRAPDDLAGRPPERLAMAAPGVPAGEYARSALARLGLAERLGPRIVDADSVRTALAWVARGEADAAIVYATDARVEPRVRTAFAFPAGTHPPIVYSAGLVEGAPRAAEARRFLDFCRSAEARALFAAAGFTPPPAGGRAATVAAATTAGGVPAAAGAAAAAPTARP